MGDSGATLASVGAFAWITLGVQAVGVVILLFYTCYTAKQVRALIASNATNREMLEETRASVGIARDTLILSRRVWLNVEIDGAPAISGRRHSEIRVSLRNVGGIPAARIHFGVAATLQTGAEMQELPQVSLEPVTPLGVQQSAHYPVHLEHLEELTASITRGGYVLHVYGEATYDDGFHDSGRHIAFAWYAAGRNLDEWFFTPGVHRLE